MEIYVIPIYYSKPHFSKYQGDMSLNIKNITVNTFQYKL